MKNGVACGSPNYAEYPPWYDDVDEPDQKRVGESTVHTARASHYCDGCTRPINPGQRYRRQFWLVDGEPTVIKKHLGAYCEMEYPV